MIGLISVNFISRRHKGKTAFEMASKKLNLKVLLEEHAVTKEPGQVNGISNGSVSPLLERCSLSNRGKPMVGPKEKYPSIEIVNIYDTTFYVSTRMAICKK